MFICEFVLINVVVSIVKFLFVLIFFVVLKNVFGLCKDVGFKLFDNVWLFGGIIKL